MELSLTRSNSNFANSSFIKGESLQTKAIELIIFASKYCWIRRLMISFQRLRDLLQLDERMINSSNIKRIKVHFIKWFLTIRD